MATQTKGRHGVARQFNTGVPVPMTVPDGLFVLALRDEALAPEHPSGQEIVWLKSRPPRTGSLALLRDQHGREFVRKLHQHAEPGKWHAVAINKAFRSFEFPGDGLTLLAVHKGVLEEDDE